MIRPAMLNALTVLLLAVSAVFAAAEVEPMSADDFFASLSTSAKTARAATTPVPRNLRDLFVGSNTLVPKDTRVTAEHAAAVAAAGGTSVTLTAAHRPAWVRAADSSPKHAPTLTKPTLMIHGVEAQPDFVLGADDRRVYEDTSYPYGCVAKVLISGGRWCSGVLIGPRHVLTASHCVDWDRPLPTTVEINRRGTAFSSSASVIRIFKYFKVTGEDYDRSDIDGDIAVLILSERLGDAHGWMGVKKFDRSWNTQAVWANIGYPSDVRSGYYPIYQPKFSMRVIDSDGDKGLSIKSNMDQISGQSGGPSYSYFGGEPHVVAVCSGTTEPPQTNWEAGGARLVNLVVLARKQYP